MLLECERGDCLKGGVSFGGGDFILHDFDLALGIGVSSGGELLVPVEGFLQVFRCAVDAATVVGGGEPVAYDRLRLVRWGGWLVGVIVFQLEPLSHPGFLFLFCMCVQSQPRQSTQ